MGNLRQSMTDEEWKILGQMSKAQNTIEKRPWGNFTILVLLKNLQENQYIFH